MSKLAVIDGDEIAYKLAFKYQDIKYQVVRPDGSILYTCETKEEAIVSIESETDLDIIKKVIVKPIDELMFDSLSVIDEIVANSNCNDYRIMLSGYDNFRYKLATLLPYKGDRSKDDKPYYLEYIKQFFRDNYTYSQTDFLEADDLLSNFGYRNYDKVVICSTDKDLRTVPSMNYNIMSRELKIISEELARYNFFIQLAIGDSTDNIPSPYGLGDIGAEKIFKTCKENNASDVEYYQTLLPEYERYLQLKNKDGTFKTKWYEHQPIGYILYEVGNLLWMRRTLDPDERWSLPI